MALNANALFAALTTPKAYLGITDALQDTILEILVNGLSTRFDQAKGCRWIEQAFSAHALDGNGRSLLYLPAWPVTALTSIAEDGATLTEGTDFVCDYDWGVLERTSFGLIEIIPTVPPGRWSALNRRNIVATFAAGYAAADVPSDIQLAFLAQLGHEWQEQKQKSWGETSRSMSDGSVVRMERAPLLPHVEAAIAPYRRLRL